MFAFSSLCYSLDLKILDYNIYDLRIIFGYLISSPNVMTEKISLIDVKKKTGQVRKKIDREWLFKSSEDKINQNVKDEAIQKKIIVVNPEKNAAQNNKNSAENDSTQGVIVQDEKRYNKPNFLGKLFSIFSRNQVTDTFDKEKEEIRNDPVYIDDNSAKKDLVNIDDNKTKKKKKKPISVVIEPVKAGMKKKKLF